MNERRDEVRMGSKDGEVGTEQDAEICPRNTAHLKLTSTVACRIFMKTNSIHMCLLLKDVQFIKCDLTLNIPCVRFLLFFLPRPGYRDAAMMNPVTVTHCSIVMGDTVTVFSHKKSWISGSMTYHLTM